MSEGMVIPIGADLADLQQAFAQINKHVAKMGSKIESDLGKTQASFMKIQSGAGAAFRGIGTLAQHAGGAIISAFRGAAGAVKSILSGIGGALKSIIPPNWISFAAGMALLISQIKNGISTAGEFERGGVALEALSGSAAKAQSMLEGIRQTWLKTGVSISEQAPNIQKFLALGFAPGDAMKLQTNILDVAGAVGMTSEESMRLGSALAQVKAKGVVAMEELRQQIAEKGVPVFEALAAKIGVTQSALLKLVADGKVPAQTLLDVFLNMEGPFARLKGGAERMGATFTGMVSRLKGAWDILLAKFAAPINDALKPMLQSGIERLTQLMDKAKALGEKVGMAMREAFSLAQSGKSMDLLRAGLAVAFTGAGDILLRALRAAMAFLGTALPPIFNAALAKITDPRFWEGIGNTFKGLGTGIAAEIKAALPMADMAEVKRMREKSDLLGQMGNLQMGLAGNVDISQVIKQALLDGTLAAARAATGPKTDALTKAQEVLSKLLDGARRKVEAEMAADDIFGKLLKNASSYTPANDAGLAEKVSKAAAPAVMSLTRVGGGGFANTVMNNLVSEAKRQTVILKTIATNTASKISTPARFA